MYCSHCGTHLANSSDICYNCGQKVDAASCPDQPLAKVKPIVDLGIGAPRKVHAREFIDDFKLKMKDASSAHDSAEDKALEDVDVPVSQEEAADPDREEGAERAKRAPMNKRPLIACGVIVVALIACGIGASYISDAFFGPRSFVEAYFNAIADGDSEEAASMTEAHPSDERTISVLTGALADPSDRICDIEVGDIGENGSVDVSYEIGGEPFTSGVTVKDLTPHLPFFKSYAISEPAEVAVPISNSGPDRMLLNGVEFSLPSLANGQYPVHLMCLPGRYTLSALASDACTCSEMEFVVASSIIADVPDDGKGYALDMAFDSSLGAAAEQCIAAYLQSCMDQGVEDPEGAPFHAHLTSNAEFKGWTGIDAMPQVKMVEAARRKSASMQLIRDGSVLCATATGGSIGYGYSYVLPPSKLYERTGSARIQNMDVYVDLQSGDMSIAYDGKVVYGEMMGSEEEVEQELDDLISGFDLSDALQSMGAGL